MSQVIQFLASLGGNRVIHSASDYAATVAALDTTDAYREALLDRDHVELNDLLGGREKLFCVVYAPDQQDNEDGGEPPPEPVEDAPESK